MSFIFINKPSVTDDIQDIVDYYKNIHLELAIEFLDRLEEAKKHIANFPEAFQIKYKNVRMVLLMQFPYQIHYIVDEEKMQIIILAIIHAYKKPRDYSKK
jgi:plasmid stabilization system protein ParE